MSLDDIQPSVIAVVGAGFSGTLVAAHLLRQQRPLTILLIERSGRFGTGLAYGTTDPGHLLNVSAGNMSAHPSDPGHLLRWLELNREPLEGLLLGPIDASSFLPRQVFGFYLTSVLEEARIHAGDGLKLERITADVVDLQPIGAAGGFRLSLGDGRELQADRVVLAWGNTAIPVEATRTANPSGSDRHWRQGWAADATEGLDPDASVLLLGTGLTMVDMVVSLQRQGHRGPVVALSRRGHAPNAHRAYRPIAPFLSSADAPRTVLGLWRLIRERAELAIRDGDDWRGVIDALRPITQELWRQLPDVERRRFLRHAAVVWDVHRHRIAADLHDLLQDWIGRGQLQILAGRLLDVQQVEGGLGLRLRRRHAHTDEVLRVERVISCTGIPLDYERADQPLLRRLREQHLLRSDPLALGLASAADGGLIDADGQRVPGLYTIGSPRKGDLWETIAVPELRHQAADLARSLVKSLPLHLLPLAPVTAAGATTVSSLLWRQLFDPETSTYTYLVADRASGEAALIDPVREQLERDLEVLRELNLHLSFCLETHLHADHITSAGELRRRTGCRLIVPASAEVLNADRMLEGGEKLPLGSLTIEAIASPGHTASHMAYLVEGRYLASGDALLIRSCGRTDFQGGDPGHLYDSLQRLLVLPESTVVYPAHDYRGRTASTIGEEKRFNPKIAGRSRHSFITLMNNQLLAPPARIDQALPANAHLGDFVAASDDDDQTRTARQQDEQRALANEQINKDIYNDFIGMCI
ncbi:MAG: FAD/NAD(P)-binding protein [Synechococcus lacustris]